MEKSNLAKQELFENSCISQSVSLNEFSKNDSLFCQQFFDKSKANLGTRTSTNLSLNRTTVNSSDIISRSTLSQKEPPPCTSIASRRTLHNNTRQSYYNALVKSKVLNSKIKFPLHHTLIIFDWDDTLLFSSYIDQKNLYDLNNLNNLTQKEKRTIYRIEEKIKTLLQLSIEHGDVAIITNSSKGWVEDTAKVFFPSISPILSKIKIISARENYADIYPRNYLMWKYAAFRELFQSYESDNIINFICFGDTVGDQEVGKTVSNYFSYAMKKIVKFKERPKLIELNNQLKLIIRIFEILVNMPKNWEITIS